MFVALKDRDGDAMEMEDTSEREATGPGSDHRGARLVRHGQAP